MDYSLDEMLSELKREIVMRKRVYPGLVDAGRMNPEEMEYRIDILKAIIKELKDKFDKQGKLFD